MTFYNISNFFRLLFNSIFYGEDNTQRQIALMSITYGNDDNISSHLLKLLETKIKQRV